MAAGALLLMATLPLAQPRPMRAIVVTEATGIRRSEYPVSAWIEFANGALTDAAHARLYYNNAEVPGQYTTALKWDDGSVRILNVDFNVSIGPLERRTYQLQYGPDVAAAPVARGFTVTDAAGAIQVGNVRFGKSGSPLIVSAAYANMEFIGKGRNGLAIVDVAGFRHDLSTVQQLTVELQKRGPLSVLVQYSGRIPLDGVYSVPFVLVCEMPFTKSWVKVSASVQDPGRRVRSIGLDSPLAFGAYPWTWDFATPNHTYGVFRSPTDTAVLTQTVDDAGPAGWTVQTGPVDRLVMYEASPPGRGALAGGWGHLLDARGAVAFAMDRVATEAGTYTITVNGEGQASFMFTPARPATARQVTVYQHFVSTPVAIGAATNPTAMLNPLVVSYK